MEFPYLQFQVSCSCLWSFWRCYWYMLGWLIWLTQLSTFGFHSFPGTWRTKVRFDVSNGCNLFFFLWRCMHHWFPQVRKIPAFLNCFVGNTWCLGVASLADTPNRKWQWWLISGQNSVAIAKAISIRWNIRQYKVHQKYSNIMNTNPLLAITTA